MLNMNSIMKRISIHIVISLFAFVSVGFSQDQTVGLFLNEAEAYEGYTLFTPKKGTSTYLIDMNGDLIHEWESGYTPTMTVYLLEDGNLLRSSSLEWDISSQKGGFQVLDWDGKVLWEYAYGTQHHDIEPLPNGNVLLITDESFDKTEMLAAGRRPELVGNALRTLHILEIQNSGQGIGEIVWEWRAWDHLIQDFDSSMQNFGDVAAHPELMDINFAESSERDWLHSNGIAYNTDLDQIVISNRGINEIWVIDHSTNTEEASGHSGGNSGKGGDLLYRWGNPASYRAGSADDQRLFQQHDAHWIPSGFQGEGNILIFNNGVGRPDSVYSTINEIVLPLDSLGIYSINSGFAYAPVESIWEYKSEIPEDFYASRFSSSQRLPNGNTLICAGVGGIFFEVTPDDSIVWKYISPVDDGIPVAQGDSVFNNDVGRCFRYAPDYPGLTGRDLTPGDPIELEPDDIGTIKNTQVKEFNLFQNYPNPFNPQTTLKYELSNSSSVKLTVFNVLGEEIQTIVEGIKNPGIHTYVFDAGNLPSGVYFYRIDIGKMNMLMRKMILLK